MTPADVVVPKPSTSPRPSATPPSNPQMSPSEQVVKDVRQYDSIVETSTMKASVGGFHVYIGNNGKAWSI